jgi:hypothetical protein
MQLRFLAVLLLAAALGVGQQADPWKTTDLISAPDLAAVLQSKDGKRPIILATPFPVLYRSKRIPGAKWAGPGGKPEGIETLKKAVEGLPKDSDLVLYCGCCPMKQCPNMRPAFRALRELGFTKIRVLDIPTNMHTDWYTKNFPTDDTPVQAQ